MIPDLFPVKDYLQGKPVYPVARRAMNFLFSVSISSFIFEKFYFKYNWLDVTDYKSILDFLIKGYFFIPFSIFVIVHYSLDWFSHIFYSSFISIGSDKFQKKIIALTFKKSDAKGILKTLKKNPVLKKQDEPWFYAFYQHVVNSVTPEQWQKILSELDKKKNDNEKNFQLAVKAIFTISIYFWSVPFFGWRLYTLVIIVLLLILILLYWGYLIMELSPLALQKLHQEVTMYMERINDNRSTESEGHVGKQ
ncbi:MAG TPA: hypothetical protein VHS53_09595 [Mucilaginibacter sp.]|jgi:hypothetical protein|nr:hypothetical protein [Mucilaginibacter sp.]